MNLNEMNLKQQLNKFAVYGDRTAFRFKAGRDEIREKTYSEFVREVNALGSALLEKGFQGKHVAVVSENRYEWIVSYLAVTCGGMVAVPIDRDLPDEAIVYLLGESDAACVLHSDTYRDIVPAADIPMLCFDGDEYKAAVSAGGILPDIAAAPEKVAAILFTSGTTGFSKGVMLTHKNIVSNIYAATVYEKYGEHETMLSILPYHHAFECTVGLLASLTYGATVCINESLKYFSKNLGLYKPTGMFAVPAVVSAMYKKAEAAEKKVGKFLAKGAIKKAFGGRLERIYSGSAPLEPKLIEAFRRYGVQLCQGYGLTETSPVVSSTQYARLNEKNVYSVGQVVPGCEVKIAGGEILVKGDNVMKGYYKKPKATAEVFNEDGWFKTGDLGHLDGDGFLYISGRKKNVIIAGGGENVYPEEIEQFLYADKRIADAMVYGGEDSSTVTAVIYPNYDEFAEKSDEDIRKIIGRIVADVNSKLPLYKHILAVKIRKTEFEKTTSRKVKRNEYNQGEF